MLVKEHYQKPQDGASFGFVFVDHSGMMIKFVNDKVGYYHHNSSYCLEA